MMGASNNPREWPAEVLARLPESTLRELGVKPKLPQPPPATDTPAAPRGLNKTEQAYAQHLGVRQRAGEVRWFAFQGVRLLIAHADRRTFYTPDFPVLLADGTWEMHEVKGHWQEAARVRIRVAAGLYPFRFVAARRQGAGWAYEHFTGAAR